MTAPFKPDLLTLAGRLTYAWRLRAPSLGAKATSVALAEAISDVLGKAVHQTTAADWLSKGAIPRDDATRLALARLVRADPGWLYYGPENSRAPAPDTEGTPFYDVANEDEGAGEETG